MSAAATPTERPCGERAGDERSRAREFGRLMGRWRELREQGRGRAVPDCFCGSLDDLRRLVADLEAGQQHARQYRHARQQQPREQHEHQDHEHHNEFEREIEDEEPEP